ncbi:MAG: hypothetical protein NC123_18035 [Butyrivibrio sp.]|nr:hypothetical protein [Ruminococcus flavefaciens]MCM1561412.1 hypothetical protein [Butyrivibrio sp.]
MELSQEQLECLRTVGSQGIALVPQNMLNICEYLQSEGYIEMITVMTRDTSQDYPSDELHMNDANLIIQITQRGKAYLEAHTKNDKKYFTDIFLKVLPIIISVISLLYAFFK